MIVAGVRTAAVVGVGIATLSAFIGAGGLGQFINRGLSLSNHQLILLGAIPAAALALLVDGLLGAAHWASQTRRAGGKGRFPLFRAAALASPLLLFAAGAVAVHGPNPFAGESLSGARARGPVVRIGSKNFSEQLILGELMAQLIERETDIRVERIFDLGGTMICHGAIVDGEIDMYAEYSGTALTAILNRPSQSNSEAVMKTVSQAYLDDFSAVWLRPFGFNNTYALAVREEAAEKNAWTTISDLKDAASTLRAGWTFEFSERPDGYPGLRDRYGFTFGSVRDLETSLMYQAAARGEVDVICAFATDGRIGEHRLLALEDDRKFFPPYQAAPVVRSETLAAHPELERVLNRLGGALTDGVMRELNRKVDVDGLTPGEVARGFLEKKPSLGI